MPILYTLKTSSFPFEKPKTALRSEERKISNPLIIIYYVESRFNW